MKPGSIRVGQGFDVHPWSDNPADKLVLGGVSFADHRGLAGHSDSDVIAHACTDAVLGAIGLGDIGQLFPDTDPSLSGANSVALLAEAVAAVRSVGWDVANIDCTIVLDEPKIAPVRGDMERNLAAAVGAPVAVKGKRTEGVAALAEGVQCFAVALLYKPDPDDQTTVETEHNDEDN
ncbi:MAG: 2-C-methyl-D-erythritol 2,4-cyclodiphosphate synthase [Acidimicrobiales bacterium]